MKIYASEIKDGIADLVQSSASVAYCMPATINDDVHKNSSEFAQKIKADSGNPKQIDLYYLKSVLVSTGWNKNDDVFPAQATWDARNTPEDKQFNFMHNENDIIGHITGSYVINRDGSPVEDDTQPDDFDIITEAVLYNSWTDPENRQRMNQIIAEIEEGKWYVSMECLFAGFDYALLDEQGNAKLLERNEGSAFLTKHLRAYGGNGEYEGYKVGRSLRDISFSGKGLVSKPANPRSIILDASKAFSLDPTDKILTNVPKNGEFNMSENNVLEQQVADLRSELASAREDNIKLQAQLDEATSKEYVESIAKLETSVAEAKEAVAALEATVAEKEAAITELQETVEAKDKDMKEKMDELNKMKKEKKAEARKAALLEVGFEADEVEATLASYETLEDDAFEAIIAAVEYMNKKKGAVKDDEKEAKAKPSMKVPVRADEEEVEAEEAEAEAEAEVAAEEALEEVETTEATMVEASDETDELEATRASVAEWLESNVLSK
tara:strand:- start:895 stop:2385 length:1491 start_codon:yes stop_codon:yes gene_type:complete